MKDVIFQGSRNRKPSGMAEVVLHLVRDEIVEHEPDIEDIDSTLEQIDEHSAVFEEAEITTPAVEPTVLTEATIEASPTETDPADATTNDATTDTRSRIPTHHRHWRRRN